MKELDPIRQRKSAHIEICKDKSRYQVESSSARFDELNFIHQPAAQLSFHQIKLESSFLGFPIRAPFFISAMTGGSAGSYELNRGLARAAEQTGIPVGMGSIRILIRKPEVIEDFQLKKVAPSVPVFANIGIVQLRDEDQDKILSLLEKLQVDALSVHMNPAQELFQAEGDRDFAATLPALEAFISRSPVPVILKETGFGIPPGLVEELLSLGAHAIDLAGAGGTNWVRVEEYRNNETLGEETLALDNWGIPSALNIAALFGTGKSRKRSGLTGKILASGGIRTALDGAKALALGASAFGLALPALRAYTSGGIPALLAFLENLKDGLRRVFLLAGASSVSELPDLPLVFSRDFVFEAAQYGNETS